MENWGCDDSAPAPAETEVQTDVEATQVQRESLEELESARAAKKPRCGPGPVPAPLAGLTHFVGRNASEDCKELLLYDLMVPRRTVGSSLSHRAAEEPR